MHPDEIGLEEILEEFSKCSTYEKPLRCLSPYVWWHKDFDDKVQLDGYFTIEQLEFIIAAIRKVSNRKEK